MLKFHQEALKLMSPVIVVDSRLPPHLRSAGGRQHGAHDSPGHMRVSRCILSQLESLAAG